MKNNATGDKLPIRKGTRNRVLDTKLPDNNFIRFTHIISPFKQIVKGNRKLLILSVCILLRLLNIVCIRTSFVADEYWQSLEVAHKHVFRYGSLTWEWVYCVRNYLYVTWIIWLYKILQTFGWDTAENVIYGPRIVQSVFSAISDTYYISFVYKYFRTEIANWCVITYLLNFIIIYCSTRTITNTAEMNLAIIAMYYVPWRKRDGNVTYLWLVGLMCLIKPTAFFMWIIISLYVLFQSAKPMRTFCKYILVIIAIVIFGIVLDWYMYGKFCVSWLYFYVFNIHFDISSFYSTHPFWWYIFIAFPIVLNLHMLPFLVFIAKWITGFYPKHTIRDLMTYSILCYTFVLSLIPHKEFRFLLPILPFMLIVSSYEINKFVSGDRAKNYKLIYTCGFVIVNVALIIYFGLFHKSAPLAVMKSLRASPENKIAFLLPCHITPLYSHLHMNVSTKFVACNPPMLNLSNVYEFPNEDLENSSDIADKIEGWTHIVTNSHLLQKFDKLFLSRGFRLHTVFRNAPFNFIPDYDVINLLVYQTDELVNSTAR